MSSNLAQYFHSDRYKTATVVLNLALVRQSVEELIGLLFPQRGCLAVRNPEEIDQLINDLKARFKENFESVSSLNPDLKSTAGEKVEAFFAELPKIGELLDTDVAAAFAGDPAAYSREEIIITYPGFYAVCVYRLASALWRMKIPLIPRLMSEYAHEKTGIDIHPGAQIDESFFIDHGTGVVIGETSIIGKNVKIYQGVTLGALSVKKRMQSRKRHPTIEHDVVIYANSTILGGETVIGSNSVIGGNVWLTESIPSESMVLNKFEKSQTMSSR
jgi:serine O-acetyltransferase